MPGQVGHVLAQPESGERVLGHGDQSGQALTVVLGGGASPVERGSDDPQLLAAAVDGDPDLGAGRWFGPEPDPLVAQQVTGTRGERVHHGRPVADGLHADSGVEQDLESSGVLTPAGLSSGGHHDRRDRYGQQECGPLRQLAHDEGGEVAERRDTEERDEGSERTRRPQTRADAQALLEAERDGGDHEVDEEVDGGADTCGQQLRGCVRARRPSSR